MKKLEFNKGERVSAAKMNDLSGRVASGSSRYGGVRSNDGVTPLKIRDRRLTKQSTPTPYPFQVDSKFDTYGYYRVRGGKIEIIDSEQTHYEIEIGTPIDYSGWVRANDDGFVPVYYTAPYYICLQITKSIDPNDPSAWGAGIVTILQSDWPTDEHDGTSGYNHFIIAADNATTGTSETPDIQQHFFGGVINIDYPMFGGAPSNPNGGSSSAGTSLKYSREDHVHKSSRLDQIQSATANTELLPDSDDTRTLKIGKTGTPDYQWSQIDMFSAGIISLNTDDGSYQSSITIDPSSGIDIVSDKQIDINTSADIVIDGNGVDVIGAGGDVTISTGASSSGDITINSDGDLYILNLPTSAPSGSGKIWNDGGTLKIT